MRRPGEAPELLLKEEILALDARAKVRHAGKERLDIDTSNREPGIAVIFQSKSSVPSKLHDLFAQMSVSSSAWNVVDLGDGRFALELPEGSFIDGFTNGMVQFYVSGREQPFCMSIFDMLRILGTNSQVCWRNYHSDWDGKDLFTRSADAEEGED